MADPGEGLGPRPPPLILDPNEAQRAEKIFFEPPPPLISGSGWPPLPHLKVSIRYCLPTCLPTCSSTPWPDYMLTYMGTGAFTICTNQSGGNLVHYCKVYKIWLGGRSTGYTVYQNQLNRPKRIEKLHHLTNHGPYFLKLPIQNGPNHLIFQLLFSVFLCKW